MAEARLKQVDRSQSYWGQVDVESLIGVEHAARAIWELSQGLEISGFLKDNKSVEGIAGAERTDPRVLISVWVYGLTLGIGSARELERRLEQEPGLRWLCGDERINHHTLSDFRVEHGEALEKIFSQVLAALSQSGMVQLEELTVDGTKIQAQASGGSLRRERTLREHLEQAEAVVQHLSQCNGEPVSARVEAARRRAARERQQRLKQALEELEQIRPSQRQQARVSMSEPEARVMKNGQGGFAPSYNVQSVVDGAHKIVLDVEVTQAASDQQQLPPALERIQAQLVAGKTDGDRGWRISQRAQHRRGGERRGGIGGAGAPAGTGARAGQAAIAGASRHRRGVRPAGISDSRGWRGAGVSGGPTPGENFSGPELRSVSRRGKRLCGVLSPGQVLSSQRSAQREDPAGQSGGGGVSSSDAATGVHGPLQAAWRDCRISARLVERQIPVAQISCARADESASGNEVGGPSL
jgi:transposase